MNDLDDRVLRIGELRKMVTQMRKEYIPAIGKMKRSDLLAHYKQLSALKPAKETRAPVPKKKPAREEEDEEDDRSPPPARGRAPLAVVREREREREREPARPPTRERFADPPRGENPGNAKRPPARGYKKNLVEELEEDAY